MTHDESRGLGPRLTIVLAAACGLLGANLYYSQALIGQIAPALGLAGTIAGLPVTITQIGYGIGLFFLVSLADLVENRTMILWLTGGVCIAETGLFLAVNALQFLLFSFLAGICAVGSQVIIPLAAHLAPADRRGAVVGNVTSGLLTGIMLARPIANAVSAVAGWRAIFALSAAGMAALSLVLARTLPRRTPVHSLHYGQILLSSLHLLVSVPAIRRRTAYQACLFAAFNLFWTAAPILLGSRFALGQVGIALFALAGAGGALAAPIAGRLGDRGHVRRGTGFALAGVAVAFALAGWAGTAQILVALVFAAILLDAAVQMNQVLGQRVLFTVEPAARGRINGIYMTIVFFGGAAGSLLASLSLANGGWVATAAVGTALGTAAFFLFLTERRTAP